MPPVDLLSTFLDEQQSLYSKPGIEEPQKTQGEDRFRNLSPCTF